MLQKKALIIPCYNEAKRLQTQEFLQFARTYSDIHLWFVNDGSRDATLEMLESLVAQNPESIFYLHLPKNGGKAEAVRSAYLHLCELPQYQFIGFMDADLSAPLDEATRLFSIIAQTKSKMVTGARVKMLGTNIVRSMKRHYVSRIFATYYSQLLGLQNYDTQCGLKIMDKSIAAPIFKEPFLSKWFFDLEIFIRAKKLLGDEQYAHQIQEIPLLQWEEVGDSRLKFSDFLKAPLEVLKMYRKYKNIG